MLGVRQIGIANVDTEQQSKPIPGVIRGTRNIAAFMGVSPTTILRWRKRFRGSTEVKLCFPAMEIPNGIGWSWSVWTHTALILEWMQRWCEIDGQAIQEGRKRKRRAKVEQIGVTDAAEKGRPAAGEAQTLREDRPAPRMSCTCGSATPCQYPH